MLERGFYVNQLEKEKRKKERQDMVEKEAESLVEWIVNACRYYLEDDTKFRITVSEKTSECNEDVNVEIKTDSALRRKSLPKYNSSQKEKSVIIDAVKYIKEISAESDWINISYADREEKELYAIQVSIDFKKRKEHF